MSLTKSTSLSITSLIFSLILITSSTASRHEHFQILDVSASLRRARQIFSPLIQQKQPLNSSADSLSITLHSRSSLLFHYNKNYTSLTLARLARDKARVHSLLSKHSRALSRSFSNSNSIRSSHELESPVVSGTSEGSGEYLARVGVGRPVREFYMLVDTGSDVTWLQCTPCAHCYLQSDPLYNPAYSSTYNPLPCNSNYCVSLDNSACLFNSCLYKVIYGDGSYTIGNFVTETISFGSTGSVPDVAIGCGHHNGGLFFGEDGLVGLGGGALSLPSQIKATNFSYCLVNRDSNSSSTLDFNSSRPADSVVAPLLNNSFIDTFYYVGLTGISVGGQPVQFPSTLFEISDSGRGGVIVDSGTTVSLLRSEVYSLVRNAFRNMSRNLSYAGGYALFDTCYNLSSESRVRVPTVSFQFSGGKTLVLPPSNYLIPVDDKGKFCFAFAATSGKMSIIGNVQQQEMRVSYDLANRSIGFSLNKC